LLSVINVERVDDILSPVAIREKLAAMTDSTWRTVRDELMAH
jgi:hypothetical protein